MDAMNVAKRERLLTGKFLLVMAATLAYFISQGALLPILPSFVVDQLGGSKAMVGLAIGAFSISAVLMRPIAGRLGDVRGRRILIVSGGAIFAVAIIAQMAATTIAMVVALRLVMGVGEALIFTGAASATSDLSPASRRGEAMSYFSLGIWSGIAIGAQLGERIFVSFGYNAAWLGAGVLSLAASVFAILLPSLKQEEIPAKTRLVHPLVLGPGVVLAASVWGLAGFLSFVPLYAREVGMHGSAIVFTLYGGTIVLIRSLGAKLPDRLGPPRAATISLLGSTLGLLLLASWPHAAGIIAGTLLFAMGQALGFPAMMALALSKVPPSERGSAIGTFTAFLDIAFGLGPLTLGAAAESIGYRGAFAGAALVALFGFVILRLIVSSARNAKQVEPSHA